MAYTCFESYHATAYTTCDGAGALIQPGCHQATGQMMSCSVLLFGHQALNLPGEAEYNANVDLGFISNDFFHP